MCAGGRSDPDRSEELLLKTILCAVDFSEQSRHALQWAAALAVRHEASLVVLTAVDPLFAEAARVKAKVDLVRDEIAPALDEFVAGVLPEGARHVPKTALEVRIGEAAGVILAEAARQAADLVVMGTQGLGGFRKLLLGSTTEQVLRRTRTPVLAIPHDPTGAVSVDADGVRMQLERLLVATDFSDAAASAVRWAVAAADALEIPIVLAHVVQETRVPAEWQAYAQESDEQRVAQARSRLEAIAREACAGRKCTIAITIGRPADAIAALAQEHGAGLIVMGLTSEQGPFARRPGSIAYPILSQARVPVLVVPEGQGPRG